MTQSKITYVGPEYLGRLEEACRRYHHRLGHRRCTLQPDEYSSVRVWESLVNHELTSIFDVPSDGKELANIVTSHWTASGVLWFHQLRV